ncbi:hypothetical protein FRC12_020592 [Ceratobasidium sp. 428]|nr:hypothetical protein FRC12_020592 [Ceratobasidium sp. 428]
MNPIEQAFSSMKAWLKRNTPPLFVDPDSRPWLIHQALMAITPDDACGWIENIRSNRFTRSGNIRGTIVVNKGSALRALPQVTCLTDLMTPDTRGYAEKSESRSFCKTL